MSHLEINKQNKLIVIFRAGYSTYLLPYKIGSQEGTHNTLLLEKIREQIVTDGRRIPMFVHLDLNEL